MDHIKVIFRKYDDEIIAFFPEMHVNFGKILTYQHIGQHCEADVRFYYDTKKANEAEYTPLLNELKQIYDDCILDVKFKIRSDDLRYKAWKI